MAKKKKEEVIENKPLRDEAVAIVRNAGVTPRKARLVIDLVRGKTLVEAYDILNNLNKAASPIVLKLIKSAEANAVNNFKMDPESLYIKTIYAGDGAKLKRYLPEYKNIYVIDDKYLDQLTLIQNDIDRMSAIKRDLDTFIHSSTKQPYSILLKKMKDLQIEIKKITSTLNDFHDYLGSLKADSERAYAEIRTYYVKLKEAECKIREINVAALSDYLSLRFKQGYAYLDNLNDIINSQPIDVKKLDAVYNEAVVHIDSVLAEVATEDELSLRAEDSIVYANQYRVDFSEVRVSLNTAESAFQEADFARASSEALTVIKKVRVEQGE